MLFRKHRFAITVFLTSALAMMPSLFAQDHTQTPTFSTNTNLVIVDVYAHDKSGNPVLDMPKNDLVVLEDGKPQVISVFELQQLNSEVLPEILDGPKTLMRSSNVANAPAAPAQGKVRFKDRRLIALFFDLASMQPDHQIRARDAAIKFLRTGMTKSDLVSIMTYSASLKTIENFTEERDRLIAAIHKFQVGEASEVSGLGDTDSGAEGDDSGAFTSDRTEFNIFNSDQKLAALESAARKLAAFPEKKALIYFSTGIRKTGVENQSQLRATVNAAVRANVAIYPVDVTGLLAEGPGGNASVVSPQGNGIFTGVSQRELTDTRNSQQETLVTLAADTGGQALLEVNDLSLGIKRAQRDISSYYILGYYSSNSAKDGKYRHIEVKLKKKVLEAKLEFRKGYFADKLFEKFSASDKERQLQDALMRGDPVTELPLALEIDHFRFGRDRYFVPITVRISGSAIMLAKKGVREAVELDFIGQVHDRAGKLMAAVRDRITANLDGPAASELERRSLQYDTGVMLPPGDYTLRFLARENLTGKMGTFETKFTVPDLTLEHRRLRISSAIWSAQRESLSVAVGTVDSDKKIETNHPLIQNGEKLVPSITRVFRKDQRLFVYLEVYDPTLDSERKVPSVSGDVVLYQGAKKAFESDPVHQMQLAKNRSSVLPVRFEIALNQLSAGTYKAQINLVDEVGQKVAFPQGTLVVLP
jgi:VWFA-related protein